MNSIQLGQTGLNVQRLGFGGIPIQRVGEAKAIAAVSRAIELGYNLFDTARAYSTSEHRIGQALKAGSQKQKIVVASKSLARTAKEMEADIHLSLEHLGLEKIDIYQCHMVGDMQQYETIISSGGALEALQKARDKGLISHLGLTSHKLDVLKRGVEEGPWETIMVAYSLLEPLAGEEVIPAALKRGLGVMTMKSFAGGVLEDSRLSLKWVLNHPGLIILAGMESADLVEENWSVFNGDWTITPSQGAEIQALQKEFSQAYCRRCDYCQPCSEDIPISTVLGLKSMVKRIGAEVLNRERQKKAIESVLRCAECCQCLERCPYGLPIPELLRETVAWAEKQRNR
jgi:predicted aldo/keto reductase-like oxidoreductase